LKINGFADRLKLNIGFSYRFLENPVQVLELVFFLWISILVKILIDLFCILVLFEYLFWFESGV